MPGLSGVYLLDEVMMLDVLPLVVPSVLRIPIYPIIPPSIVPFDCVLCYYQSLSLFSMRRSKKKWVYATLFSNTSEAKR